MNIAQLAAGLGVSYNPTVAHGQRRIEVPVAVDVTGKAWVLPALDSSVRVGLDPHRGLDDQQAGIDIGTGRPELKSVSSPGGTAVITETVVLDPAVQAELSRVARDVAAGAGLRGIGLVVFAVSPDSATFTLAELQRDCVNMLAPVEDVTGLDLSQLADELASGGRLLGPEPKAAGYAAAAAILAVDPESGYLPTPNGFHPADVLLAELPSGVGVRAELVHPHPDLRGWPQQHNTPGGAAVAESALECIELPAVARISARGRDRAQAVARLRSAVAATTIVVADSATNRCDLVRMLDSLATVDAPTVGWVPPRDADNLAPTPLAIIVAAVEACTAEHAARRAAFHASAARGRPEAPSQEGVKLALRSGDTALHLAVYETAPDTYRIDTGAGPAGVIEAIVARPNDFVRVVTTGSGTTVAVVSTQGATTRVEIDAHAYSFTRDDGAVVRAGWPAFVVSLKVGVGDHVSVGDPLVVLEAMKMESTVTSPYDGVVVKIDVLPNSQVEAGAALLRIRDAASDTQLPNAASTVDFTTIQPLHHAGRPECEEVYAILRNYLLGYELDPATRKAVLIRQRNLATELPPDDPNLLHCEDAFVDLFTEVALLAQRDSVPQVTDEARQTLPLSSQEYLNAYLQWLDPDRAGLPDRMRRRLSRALARYGITDLRRSGALESIVLSLFRSLNRLPELVPVIAGIMTRRLDHRQTLIPLADSRLRARFDRLTVATQGRFDNLADMARDVRFRYVEEPLLDAEQEAVQAQAEVLVNLLAADPNRTDRAELIDRLVAFPQPLRPVLLRRRLAHPEPSMVEVLLEVRARRWYRTRELRNMHFDSRHGLLMCVADYDFEGRTIHLVMTYAPYEQLPELGRALTEHFADVPPERQPVIDVMAWRHEDEPNGDELAARVTSGLAGWDVGRAIHRADITVSTVSRDAVETLASQSFTFRTKVTETGAELVEERFYRNMHPMLAKRLEIWRLGNFDLERLPSMEDVFVFHGVARNNPKDHRLFALAEVRDMTPVPRSHGGVTGYPKLERTGLQALIAMRQALAAFPARGKPQANRITLFIRPPYQIPDELLPVLAQLMLPLSTGAGLDMLVIRANVVQPDGQLKPTVFNIEGLQGGGLTIREEAPKQDPVRPLTPYRQKVLTAARFGVPYPWEILRMFAPEPGTVAKFPPSEFVEHDLDESGYDLVPVTREPGLNSANVIVGVVTTVTSRVPEGMKRVAILSDPTKGLGNLAEPECRRINAALRLAARMRVPVEWFAVSSGALISTTSGTENMDWIADTLRRIIEFTQAGGEINIVVTGINVGGQPYWNAEATMLMHTKGILVMIPTSAMVLTGKQALDFSGGVSAEDNFGIGGYDRVMGPNGQAQYWAPSLEAACQVLLEHYEYSYVPPGERFPRRAVTVDPYDRDVRPFPHAKIPGSDFTVVGDIFSNEANPDRKKPFDIRSVMRAVSDSDATTLERWSRWRGGENSVVWDTAVGGIPVCMLGLESRPLARRGFVPADGPPQWTSGTLFPQASRKTARAVNATSGKRPLVVLANLSGFDGSPESMRHWQLEYGAEIGRAVTNFDGPIVFVVISRYHGGAFVVFSKALNENLEIAAVEGSFASVIGGAPAAATVFAREVRTRVEADPRVVEMRAELAKLKGKEAAALTAKLAALTEQVRSEKLGEAADEFDSIHTIDRALQMGSVDEIIPAERLRPWVIAALERGMAKFINKPESTENPE